MKRILAILLSVLLLTSMLAGCGAKGKLRGSWQATVDISPVMQNLLQETWTNNIYVVKEFPVVVELTFLRNGSCTLNLQEGPMQQALENLRSALKADFVENLRAQLGVMDKNVSLEDVLKASGVDLKTLLQDMDDTFKNAGFPQKLREKMRFDGYYQPDGDRLHIGTTEELDEQSFALIYSLADGVLSMPMVAGENPMDPDLTAAICAGTFQKAK